MNVIYFYLFLLAHPYLGMWWKSFELADRKAWEALIPGYNYYVAFKISCKKPWWSLLLIFPGVHLVMWSVLNTSYVRKFGYYSLVDTLQGVFFPYILLAKIANAGDTTLPDTNWANSKEIGDREWGDHLALFLSLPILGHALALGLAAVTRPKPGKKTKVKEWGDSILFALVAASIIRTYVFEPFQIPTGSMEKTLLVGDFLFVNKLAYGPKVPVTPLSYPLVHNTVPWVDIKSYTGLETSNYTRLPGFSDINRNDVVVFNYPSGDTAVYDPRMPNGLMGHDYHGIVIKEAIRLWKNDNPYISKLQFKIKDSIIANSPGGIGNMQELDMWALQEAERRIWTVNGEEFVNNIDVWKKKARKMLAEEKIAFDQSSGGIIEHYGLIYRPVDKRENYIKRCVGVAGDWIEIKNSILFVNDKPAFVAENQNLQYLVSNVTITGPESMDEKYGLEAYPYYARQDYFNQNGNIFMNLTLSEKKKIQKSNPGAKFEVSLYPQYSDNKSIKPTISQRIENLSIFPKDININNTVTDFTRFQIPKKGQKIKISPENIAWYRRIITAYEGHTLSERKDGIYIDGKKVTTYTFGMNYYWMMGDNRYNSADSRMWGFVPEDHIVGKASMVWFSKSPYKGVRWERLFNIIE
jgi:signal peptidase I